ncbi:MAG: prepilin-type N-terminal cleavage/methylation domain-containing protein [Candidatus Shapirobacteria bacterium]|nr:prepilin-type N-terminal cleavage/methylation domain-containing protein [Candidatus Shapirobacteria bacterium]
MKKKIEHGFSLIELIVVVTIISVITVIGVISFNGAQKKARDGRRMADLEKIRIALEMEKQVGSTYPAALSVLETNERLQLVPQDPKGFGTYPYTGSNYLYTVYAFMEDAGSTNFSGDGTVCGTGGNCNYKVTNP